MTRRLTASEHTELLIALELRAARLNHGNDYQQMNADRVAESKATTEHLIRSLDRIRLETAGDTK